MNFEKDLFISYAHIDNKPLTPEQMGWISRFHASLQALLSMRMGGEARIWRDDKLDGNDVFADEIIDQFAKTAVLVSVLTPRYMNSEWCTREVNEFCRTAEECGGMMVDNKARIFKVLKTPVPNQEQLPLIARDVLGYEFFTFEDEAPLELDPAYGDNYAQEFNRKIGKLAWDISQLLQRLATEDGGAAPEDPDKAKPIIYLAECSYDRKETREILDGELRRHGYTVLPDQRFPMDEENYIEAVKGQLERCKLSVHLVGSTYGGVPDGPNQKSVTVIQNELAAERSKISGLPRVIWLPEGTHSDQPQQQAFIAALHQDAEAQFGADLITGDLEGLKASIHVTLEKLQKPEPEKPREQQVAVESGESGEKLIYLICNEKDRKATVPLRKYCRSQGLEIAIPAYEGDATAIREAHQDLLTNCDAVIVFYGAGDEAWKRTIDNDLKKMPGYRGGKPLMGRYTYLAAPKTADKEDLIDMDEPNLMDGLKDFSEEEMATFMNSMSGSDQAS